MNNDSNDLKNNVNYIVTNTIKNYSNESKNISNIDIKFIERSNKPLACVDIKSDQCVFFQETIAAKIEGKKITFTRPNEISLAMNIAKNSLNRSLQLRKKIVKIINNKNQASFYDDRVVDIYDYLEEVQKTIIFSYKAIEAMCNSAIPSNFIYKKESNKKGIHEIYDKSAIERWISTTEKTSKILPSIYKCASPINKSFWGHFKKLEELRNDIIHSKSNSSSKMLSDLLSSDIKKYVASCDDLLLYFFELDTTNPLFPILEKISEINILQWDDLDAAFKPID